MVNETAYSENTITYEPSAGYLIEEDFSKIPAILDRLAEERKSNERKKEIEKHKKELDFHRQYVSMLEESEKQERSAKEERELEVSRKLESDKRTLEEIRNNSNKLLNIESR